KLGEAGRQRVPAPLRRHPLPAGVTHPGRPVAIGQHLDDRAGDLVHRVAVNHQPGLVVLHRFRRSTRFTRNDRHAAGGRLEKDDAQALNVHTRAPSAARHREHVGHRVMGRQLLARHAAGERHMLIHLAVPRQLAQRLQVGAASDDYQRRPVDPPADRG
ncbi:hypothetical protein NJB1907E78_20250, partial [Mycobacterium marinum]